MRYLIFYWESLPTHRYLRLVQNTIKQKLATDTMIESAKLNVKPSNSKREKNNLTLNV